MTTPSRWLTSLEAINVRHLGRYATVLLMIAGLSGPIPFGGSTDAASAAARAHATAAAGSPRGSTATKLTPVSPDNVGAQNLAVAAFDGGGHLTASFLTVPPAYATDAVVRDFPGFWRESPTAALLTTGDARWAPEPNDFESSGRDSGGGIIRGNRTYDVTVLRVTFDAPSGSNCLSLAFRFYSEEVPEFVGRAYNDAFIAELDANTWTTNGTTIVAPDNFARDDAGNIVSANSGGAFGMAAAHAVGTTYDAATPVMTATTPITPGRHDLYLSIFDQYDAVYDSAVVIDRVQATDASTCVRGLGGALRPIILLPGIMGTRLITADGNEAWSRWILTAASVGDDHLNQLKLQDDGDTNCGGCTVAPDGIIKKISTEDFYEGCLDILQRDGYVLDTDGRPAPGESLFTFGFDWRRSAEVNAHRLLAFIDTVRQATGFEKVNLLAHSQGGLVAEAALALPGAYGKVNRVVTLGTPYLGAAQALSVLRYKEPCLFREILGGCLLNRGKVQEITRNMRGFLDLLPSDRYWWAVGSPVVRSYDGDGDGQVDGALTAQQVSQLFEGSDLFNPALIVQSRIWHETHDRFSPVDPTVGLVRIVGDGLATIGGVNVKQITVCSGNNWWMECHQEDRTEFNNVSGDGTVPRGSADLVNGTEDLSGGRPAYYFAGVSHQDLPNTDGVMAYAIGVLRVNGPTGPVSSDPTTTAVTGVAAPAGLSVEPTALAGTELSVSGPLAGLLTDPDGLRTGVIDAARGASTVDIPGSSYADSGGFASTFLADGTATGRWAAQAAGEVRITLRAYTADSITTAVAFPPFAVPAGAVITLDSVSVPLGAVTPLHVDDNADGTVDRVIAPGPAQTGAAAADKMPPSSVVTVAPYTASDGSSRVHVAISASDAGGSGVDRIEWAQPSSGASGTYAATPLDLPATGSVIVRAIDRAGNIESVYPVVSLSG